MPFDPSSVVRPDDWVDAFGRLMKLSLTLEFWAAAAFIMLVLFLLSPPWKRKKE